MASVDFQKLKGAGDTKAILRHCDTEERLKNNHSNGDINKEFTELNQNFTGKDYAKSCEKYDKRIKHLDECGNTNFRKDRVTCFALNIPAPEGMDAETCRDFFYDVAKLLANKYGAENVVGATSHFDEVHEYLEPKTGEVKTSRPHLHAQVIPEINGRLCGKEFSSIKSMKALNQAIDQLCREKYKCVFLTGEFAKAKSTYKSVEQLKNFSNFSMKEREKTLQRERADLQDLKKFRDQIKTEVAALAEQKQQYENDFKQYRPSAFEPPEVKRKKSITGKRTVEIEEDQYNAFVKQAEKLNKAAYGTKQQARENDSLREEVEVLRKDNAALIKQQEFDFKTLEHTQSELSESKKQVFSLQKGLSIIRNRAEKEHNESLANFAEYTMSFGKTPLKQAVKTVAKSISRSTRDDGLER